MRKFFFICFSIFLSSCLAPLRSFEKSKAPSAPDYSQEKYWAALPTKKDSADAIPYGTNLKDEQANAKADVFFIYPTIYLTGKHWNADVNNKKLNRRIDKSTIRHQASVFNASCKIYAPRYRQAVLWAYAMREGSGGKALDFAYEDVKKAFEYYLKNYNNGRPIILASHSQGSGHAERLLHDYFEKDSALRKKLVAAYAIGYGIKKNSYSTIPASDSASQTSCIICWNSTCWNVPADKYFGKNLECENPLTWKHDTCCANVSLNLGSVPYGFTGIDKGIADAKVSPDGLLWVHKKNKKGYPGKRRYHILDYNLFWMNIRENAKLRVETYLRHG
ncbi:MAG: DUF3089 domain-containing protein [Bacteroidetes bacterium]|nr:DUF3089 domain-containing protein [Bacteroidota bacterium]